MVLLLVSNERFCEDGDRMLSHIEEDIFMMDDILEKVKQLMPENLVAILPKDVNPASLFLLNKAEKVLQSTTNSNAVREALSFVQAVMDITWEQLNTGHWSNVPLHQRQLYTGATLLKIVGLLRKQTLGPEDRDLDVLQRVLKVTDLGLLLGAPLTDSKSGDLTVVAHIISTAVIKFSSSENKIHSSSAVTSCKEENEHFVSGGVKGMPVPVLACPSLEMFRAQHFIPHFPVILTGCMSHWPAMTRWSDIEYLRQLAGARTVPIELGAHYVHPLWSQKLMTISEFLDVHVIGQTATSKIGYLAQHPLFDQVPELKADICEPEYCCLSENTNDDALTEETDINAWFGPKGTVSPLHYDPKHNLLTQVVGEKRVLLYAPSDSSHLYPHKGSLLKNTAQVDPESPDYATFPMFQDASAWECHLRPGEMLYIPPTWWHHIRALTTSFSVSFWWM